LSAWALLSSLLPIYEKNISSNGEYQLGTFLSLLTKENIHRQKVTKAPEIFVDKISIDL
jgi:hypothetical protein